MLWRGCCTPSQRLRAQSVPFTEATWKEELATVQNSVAWHLDRSPEGLSTSSFPSPPRVCAEELMRRPQADWLVLRALWLCYIVNFGTATAFPWLVETPKHRSIVWTIQIYPRRRSSFLTAGKATVWEQWVMMITDHMTMFYHRA